MADIYNNAREQAQYYPDILNIGNTVFPLLYVYYMGNPDYKKYIGSETKFEQGLSLGVKCLELSQDDRDSTERLDVIKTNFQDNVAKYHKMLTSAAEKNRMWLWGMNNAIVALMEKYKVRVPKIKGVYYEGKDRKGTAYTPILDPNDPKNLFNMMESLRLLFENDLLAADYDMGTRPISLATGEYADKDSENLDRQRSSRLLGFPKIGQFTLNTRTIKPEYGRSFSGTDMKVIITMNDLVTMIKTMTTLSWSVHRGKPTGRPLGRPGPRGRASGSRTVAGTMIFAAGDHEPLLDIIPVESPTRKLQQTGWNTTAYRKVMMPDQLPPFDVMVIMNNEYGTAAITTIYGVEIVDYGSQYSVDNLINEHVYQYTASGMDPLVEAYADENGYFDPYGMLQGGYSEMWFRKEAAMEGLLNSDFEQQYMDILQARNQDALLTGGGKKNT